MHHADTPTFNPLFVSYCNRMHGIFDTSRCCERAECTLARTVVVGVACRDHAALRHVQPACSAPFWLSNTNIDGSMWHTFQFRQPSVHHLQASIALRSVSCVENMLVNRIGRASSASFSRSLLLYRLVHGAQALYDTYIIPTR